jgi:hypothetical protein
MNECILSTNGKNSFGESVEANRRTFKHKSIPQETQEDKIGVEGVGIVLLYLPANSIDL